MIVSQNQGVIVSQFIGVSVSHVHCVLVGKRSSVNSSFGGDDEVNDEVVDEDEETTSQTGMSQSSHRGLVPTPL